jgi:hypothetical protein
MIGSPEFDEPLSPQGEHRQVGEIDNDQNPPLDVLFGYGHTRPRWEI